MLCMCRNNAKFHSSDLVRDLLCDYFSAQNLVVDELADQVGVMDSVLCNVGYTLSSGG